MKIAIIGASGKAGHLIAEEALKRGFDVTGIVRDGSKITDDRIKIIEKDLFKLTSEDLEGFDVVVDAFNADQGKDMDHATSMNHLITIIEPLQHTRFLVVGGAGSLYVDSSRKMKLMDTDGFPEAYKPTAKNMARGLDELKKSAVNWTYLSPAVIFDYDGKRTGSYKAGEDRLLKNNEGQSYVSYSDYAIALMDEAVNNNHNRHQFTVVSEKN